MPRPNHIHSSNYTIYKVPDELLMAIIAVEAPCQGNKYIGKDGKRSDIEFDPCALHPGSKAIGLTQITRTTIEDFQNKGLIPKTSSIETVRKDICGNAALAIQYGSWNIQLKYIYNRNEKNFDKRLELAISSYGTGSLYGTKRIEEMKLLQTSYTKETILGYKPK